MVFAIVYAVSFPMSSFTMIRVSIALRLRFSLTDSRHGRITGLPLELGMLGTPYWVWRSAEVFALSWTRIRIDFLLMRRQRSSSRPCFLPQVLSLIVARRSGTLLLSRLFYLISTTILLPSIVESSSSLANSDLSQVKSEEASSFVAMGGMESLPELDSADIPPTATACPENRSR